MVVLPPTVLHTGTGVSRRRLLRLGSEDCVTRLDRISTLRRVRESKVSRSAVLGDTESKESTFYSFIQSLSTEVLMTVGLGLVPVPSLDGSFERGLGEPPPPTRVKSGKRLTGPSRR